LLFLSGSCSKTEVFKQLYYEIFLRKIGRISRSRLRGGGFTPETGLSAPIFASQKFRFNPSYDYC
jgi:hypothetical protein